MSELRKVVDAKDARACLSALGRSGETLREWCRSSRVDGRSLRAWQMKQTPRAARAEEPTRATLVELVPEMVRRPARYVVRVGDCAIEIGDDFDSDTLRRIVEALGTC